MDIHPPKHPVTSLRAFLREIFTVTCGILIALSLEGLIQYSHQRHLRAQTREDFLAEVSANRDAIGQRIKAAPADAALLRSLIDDSTRRLAHQPVPPQQPTLARDFSPLPSDAWQTALATQGIAQLDHATASVLSAAYDEQAAFNSLQERALNEWLQVAAFGNIRDDGDAAVQQALQHLRICYGLAISLGYVDQMMDRHYADAQQALRKAR